MPRQANGADIQPANTAAVSGTSINSIAFNTLITDVYTEITNSLDRAGRSAMQAALPMGGNKITGMADPTVSTDATTKAYVDAIVASLFSTGDIKPTLKSVPDSGWLMFDDGTFGSASSGSSNSNSAANVALFTLLFNSPFTDANVPIFTSGGGATTRAAQTNAASAWAANCRMSLPKALGRAFGAAGAGSGLTARIPGQAIGLETATLGMTNLPASPAPVAATAAGWQPTINNGTASAVTTGVGAAATAVTLGGGGSVFGSPTFVIMDAMPPRVVNSNTANLGSGTPVAIMPPTTFVNWMVKQ